MTQIMLINELYYCKEKNVKCKVHEKFHVHEKRFLVRNTYIFFWQADVSNKIKFFIKLATEKNINLECEKK